MIQSGDDTCLTLEARDTVRFGCKRVWQDLDGDIATELRVVGPVHLTHAAAAEKRPHVEGSDSTAHERGGHIAGGGAVKCVGRTANELDKGIRHERLVQQRLDLQLQVRVTLAFRVLTRRP